MSIQASLDDALQNVLRPEALARMTSTCNIRRKTGGTAIVGGFKVDEWATIHASEPLRYVGGAASSTGTRRIEIAFVAYQEATGRADFRHDLPDLEDGDYVDITAGEWAGTVLRVLEATKGDQRTARRVPVVEAARPEEWA